MYQDPANFTIQLNPYSIQDINNAVLSGVKSMPAKDINSDGTNDFSIARRAYAETITETPNTVTQNLAKKWYGSSNRDASQIAANRRIREIGVGSLNANANAMSFMSKSEQNSRIDALARVRGGGAVVPPKCTNRPGSSGVPMGTSAVNVPVVRTQNRLPMIPTQKPPYNL
jgi:hypothetical protein